MTTSKVKMEEWRKRETETEGDDKKRITKGLKKDERGRGVMTEDTGKGQ